MKHSKRLGITDFLKSTLWNSPSIYEEAMKSSQRDQWSNAISELELKKTWTAVKRADQETITTKFVYVHVDSRK